MNTIVALFVSLLFSGHVFGAEGGGEEGGILDFSWKLIVFQWINFAVLVAVVVFLFNKYLRPGLRKRAEQQRRAIEDAEKARADVEALKAEHARQVEEVRARTKEIMATAAAEAARDREEILHKARVEAQAAIDRAKDEIERERTRVVAELRREVADLTLAATRQLLSREVDSPTQKHLVEEFVASLDAKAVGR